jgi:YD repeat-containing protein
MQFVDFDGNGLLDIIYFNEKDKTWQVNYILQLMDTSVETTPQHKVLLTDNAFDEASDSVFIGDWDGDGLLGIGRFESDNAKLIYRKDNVGNSSLPANKITAITNGFGLMTDIDYRALTDYGSIDDTKPLGPRVYSKGENSETLDFGQGSPVFDLISAQRVVSKVTSDAPSYNGAGTSYDSNNTVSVTYQYAGMRAQSGGRGMLGFESITTTDQQTQIKTTTTYEQAFPFIGMPLSTVVQHNDDTLISQADNELEHIALYNGQVVMPYIHQATERKYNIDSPSLTDLLSKVVTTNTYEDTAGTGHYANLTSVAIETYAGTSTGASSTPYQTTTTSNKFESDNEVYWWLGLVTSTRVKQERPNAIPSSQRIMTRESSFTYYPLGQTNRGMLATETVNGLTTLHCYDKWGNKITTISHANVGDVSCNSVNKSTSDATNKVFRRNWVNYDNDGRYVTSQGNDKFITSTVNFDQRNPMGQAEKITDINDIETYINYDAFGRQYYSNNSIGQKVIVSRAFDSSFTGSYFVETTTADGKPTSKQYVNKLGQVIATRKQHFDGRWVTSETCYDEMGRAVKQSNPYLPGDAVYWSSTLYDTYGRVTNNTSPSGTSGHIDYSGLTMTTTATPSAGDLADIQMKTEVNSVLGETLSVQDNASTNASTNASNAIDYKYNAMGNLTRVTGIDGVAIHTTYNNYGHKEAMNDPNKGAWQYQYNALGELTLQTSANGYQTQFYRDSLGRTILKHSAGNGVDDSISYSFGANGNSHLLITENNDQQHKSYDYDRYGRLRALTTTVDNTSYVQQTTYDQYGRVFQQFDADSSNGYGCFNDSNAVVGSCLGIEHHYNNHGYLAHQQEAQRGTNSNARVYLQFTAMDAFGNVTHFNQNNGGIATVKTFDEVTGILKDISANNGALQSNTYTFDDLGNLRSRENSTLKTSGKGYLETFSYDKVNRLTHVNDVEQVSYYANGNIKHKVGVGNYCYNSARPHAVSGMQ